MGKKSQKAKGKGKKLGVARWGKVLVWIFGMAIILGIVCLKLFSTKISGEIVRRGNPFNQSMKEITLQSCGSRLPDYKYSIKLPANWTIVRRSYDEASTYFDANSDNKTFSVSCTNQGVVGGCEPQYRTKFKVADKEYNACFGLIDSVWKMNDFSLSTDKATNATISFWSDGLDRLSIEKILSTFNLVGSE